MRQRLAQSWIDVEIFRLHNARTLPRLARGEELGAESSIVKLFWAGMSQRLYETAVAALAPTHSSCPTPTRDRRRPVGARLAASRANSIMGGTSEIQRNIIGERMLGLPREPKVSMTAASTCSTSSIRSATRARGYPHEVWTRLGPRRRSRTSPARLRAVLGDHEARRHPRDLEAAAALLERAGDHAAPAGAVMPPSEMVVMLDPPRHGPVRRVANGRFTPRAVRGQRDDIERIAVEILDGAALGRDTSGELDFVERIAAPFPLGVIAWVLGVPSDDWELLFRWTNEVIGKDDPEYRRPGESPGADEQAGARRAARDFRRSSISAGPTRRTIW